MCFAEEGEVGATIDSDTGARHAVLIIDDDPSWLESLRERLELEGLFVHTASSAGEALKRLRMCSYDVVLSDYMMPGNGRRVLEYVRAVQPGTAVVVITAAEVEVAEQMDGAVAWLRKPVEPAALERALHAALLSTDGGHG